MKPDEHGSEACLRDSLDRVMAGKTVSFYCATIKSAAASCERFCQLALRAGAKLSQHAPFEISLIVDNKRLGKISFNVIGKCAVPIEDLPSSYSLKTPDVEIVQISTPWKNVDLVSKYGPLILDDMAGGVIEAGETITLVIDQGTALDIGPFECKGRTWE